MFSGEKLYWVDKIDNIIREKYHKSLLTERELRSLAVSSLYRLSPNQQEYRINRIFKTVIERIKFYPEFLSEGINIEVKRIKRGK